MIMMNKAIMFIAATVILAPQIFADTVVLRDGGTVENAAIVEIGTREIRYRITGRDVLYSIDKADAEKIVYADSTEDVFDAPESDYAERRAVGRHDKFQPRGGYGYGQPFDRGRRRPPFSHGEYGAANAFAARQQADTIIPTNAQAAAAPTGLKALKFEVRAAAGGIDARANPDSISYGYAVSIGAALKIPLSDAASIKPEISLSYRTPIIKRSGDWDLASSTRLEFLYTNIKSVSEFAAGVRLTAQGAPSAASKLFFEIGGAMDIPFAVEFKNKTTIGVSGDDINIDYTTLRSDIDYGVIYGAGIRLTNRLSIAARHTVFVNSYLKAENKNFSIFDIGANVEL